MAERVINWDHPVGAFLPTEKGEIVVVQQMLVGFTGSILEQAKYFLCDPSRAGRFAFRVRLVRDDLTGVVSKQVMTFWITDPDVAFEFKLRFG